MPIKKVRVLNSDTTVVPTGCLWETVSLFKELKEYYETHTFNNRPSDEEIRKRIHDVFDKKEPQRDEIATLYWVLGERDERKY